jgi:2-methylisocitrate lyase-like PEP mutase family enzyme
MTFSLIDLMRTAGTTMIAGAHDAISARIAEQAGFRAIFLSGSGTAASAFGKPDTGLITMSEMAEQCRRMARATNAAIMADGDTGFGDQNAIRRTVEEFEASGVAGITIEDQSWPKRCGYMEGLTVVDDREIRVRIEAAVAARKNPRFAIVGRTDSLAEEGLDAAVKRGATIVSAGADALWIVGLQKLPDEELTRVREAFDIPLLVDHSEVPGTIARTADDYDRLGFEAVVYPLSSILATVNALTHAFQELATKRSWEPYRASLADFEAYNRLAGVEDELAFGAQFTKDEKQ